jgi:hypothetical protein
MVNYPYFPLLQGVHKRPAQRKFIKFITMPSPYHTIWKFNIPLAEAIEGVRASILARKETDRPWALVSEDVCFHVLLITHYVGWQIYLYSHY